MCFHFTSPEVLIELICKEPVTCNRIILKVLKKAYVIRMLASVYYSLRCLNTNHLCECVYLLGFVGMVFFLIFPWNMDAVVSAEGGCLFLSVEVLNFLFLCDPLCKLLEEHLLKSVTLPGPLDHIDQWDLKF